MATKKSDIPFNQARVLIDRICAELGFHTSEKSAFLKIECPSTRHRMYVSMSKTLGHIDTTLPVKGEPGTYPLSKHNGSITCHIEPDLESLERYMRMLADGSMGKQTINRPRPMAIVRGPAARAPKPVTAAQPAAGGDRRHPDLVAKLEALKERQRKAKERRRLEEQGIDPDLADRAADVIGQSGIDEDDLIDAARNSRDQELSEDLYEAGIDVKP